MRRWMTGVTAATLLLAVAAGWAVGQLAGGGDDLPLVVTQAAPGEVVPTPSSAAIDDTSPAADSTLAPSASATPGGTPVSTAVGHRNDGSSG
jgi:hypothetical protein